MILHPSFGVGIILTSLAAVYGGSSLVAADDFACNMVLEFDTWEEKTLPREDVSVPDTDLLQHGILNVLAEQFDTHAGPDIWMTTHNFKSYQLKETNSDALALEDSKFSDMHRQLRRKKKKIPKNANHKTQHPVPEEDGLFRGHFVLGESTNALDNDDDMIKALKEGNDDILEELMKKSNSLRKLPGPASSYPEDDYGMHDFILEDTVSVDPEFSGRFLKKDISSRDGDSPFPGTMSYSCWNDKECRSESYVRKNNNYNSFHWIKSGICNLCDETDGLVMHMQEEERERATVKGEEKKAATEKKRGPKMLLTLDQFIGGIQEQDYTLGGSMASHIAFEEDVCNELTYLQEDFPTLRTIEDCKIKFLCQQSFGEEFDEDDYDETTIFDNRYEGERAEENGFLSFVFQWYMNHNGDEDGATLYSVTAAN